MVSKHPAQEYGTTIEDNFASAYVLAEKHENFYPSVVTTEFVHRNLEIFVYIDGKYQNSSVWAELDLSKPVEENYHGKRGAKWWRSGGDIRETVEIRWVD